MGKITDALKKAAEERLSRIERLDASSEVKYQFIAAKTTDSKVDPRIVTFFDSHAPVAEQYRTLRTNIQALSPSKPLKAITITSAVHGEGKTITAINLAVSMAKDLNKKKILLVDADLRRSRVNRYLGLDAQAGLAELLNDGTSLDDCLFSIGIDNLTLLPAGKAAHNPGELLNSAKMRNLISSLKEKYDYIIFDTPPVIPVTDPVLIGALTDGVVLVVQAGRTQRGVIKHGEGLLRQANVKLLGCIITNVQYHIPEYIYRYL